MLLAAAAVLSGVRWLEAAFSVCCGRIVVVVVTVVVVVEAMVMVEVVISVFFFFYSKHKLANSLSFAHAHFFNNNNNNNIFVKVTRTKCKFIIYKIFSRIFRYLHNCQFHYDFPYDLSHAKKIEYIFVSLHGEDVEQSNARSR